MDNINDLPEFRLDLEKVEAIKKLKGWTNKTIAELLDREPSEVCAYLTGDKEPSKIFLRKLCHLFTINFEDLIITIRK